MTRPKTTPYDTHHRLAAGKWQLRAEIVVRCQSPVTADGGPDHQALDRAGALGLAGIVRVHAQRDGLRDQTAYPFWDDPDT